MYFAATVLSVSSWKIMLRNGKKIPSTRDTKVSFCRQYPMRFVLKRVIIFCAFLLHAGTAAAQQRPSLGAFLKEERIFSFRSPKGYVPMLMHNFGRQAVSPLHLNEQSFLILAGAGGATAALYYYDEDIDAWIRPWRDRHPFLRDFSPHFTQLGDYYGYALVAGYGLTAMALRDHRHFRTAILASQAAITAGVWVRVVKVLTGRMRPLATYTDDVYPYDHWFGPFAVFDKKLKQGRSVAAFDAFPSGHTAAAFSIATVFAGRFSEHRAVPVVAYGTASLVAFSRLIEHEHWASDLIFGALAGYACGRQVLRREQEVFGEEKAQGRRRVEVEYGLAPIPTGGGLQVLLRF
jgi:membrane-associated phospholipid phosphatase